LHFANSFSDKGISQMSILTVRPQGERWAVALICQAQAIKLGQFTSRGDATKAARHIARILGVEFRP
jgi:hypothetical protein